MQFVSTPICYVNRPLLATAVSQFLTFSRVEERRGGLRHCQSLRFPSPLIEPDVRISRIRLSDWIHRMASGSSVHGSAFLGSGPMCTRRKRKTP